jgi:DNA-binding response OmpR family regulator
MPYIYIIEDDEDINELLIYNLEKERFKVKSFFNSKDALKSLEEGDIPDLIILDIMLPDIDGLEFCKSLKAKEDLAHIPIIMLTAKSTEIDRIVGLELGADDYITKPFSFRELIARIKAVLRRTKRQDNSKSKIIKIGDLIINPLKLEVKLKDQPIKLTSKEFKLLLTLINSKNRALSRDYLLDTVWKGELDIIDRTIDVHIKKLRTKLGDYGKYIKTIRGYGYMWEEENTD